MSTVSSTAALIVKAVPLSETNYIVAWEALQEAYDNKRLLITNHLDMIFRVSVMSTETLAGLTHFLSVFRKNISAIRLLDVENLAGFLLFYVASRVLSPTTKRMFEAEHHVLEIPDIDLLLKFVQTRCQILQNSVPIHNVSPIKTNFKNSVKGKVASFTATVDSKLCKCCKGSHFLHQCTQFSQLPIFQRFKFSQSRHLCMNCLSPQHKTKDCTSIHSCYYCSKKHHTLLHLEKKAPKVTPTENSNRSSAATTTSPVTNTDISFNGVASSTGKVVLGTAMIQIRNNMGKLVPIRALIDTGSQISVITSACASLLGLQRRRSNTSVTGLSQTRMSPTKGSTSCIFTSAYSDHLNVKCEPLILSKIIGPMPASPLNSTIRQAYNHVIFADPHFDNPAPIDFLLGADVYPFILGSFSRVIHTPDLPSAYETFLGWIILGQVSKGVPSPSVSLLLTTEN